MPNLEERVKQLEEEVKRLKRCNHEFEIVGGRNSNYRLFFNGSNAYIRCIKCGYRQRA